MSGGSTALSIIKQRARTAYLSHSGIVLVVARILANAEEEHPPPPGMLNAWAFGLWLPLYIIEYDGHHCAQCSTLWQIFDSGFLLMHVASTLICALV